ncbi:Uncharacterized protein Rs2_19326 [Raphanus sativus]|nr:Uncharacterized protein Rs2_19326 [Raphanus sativus]
MNTEEKNIMIRLREADSEAVVEVGDKGVDTVEGERSSNAASRNGHQIFFLKLPLEGESPKKMRFLLAKAVKHIAANPVFLAPFVSIKVSSGRIVHKHAEGFVTD